MRRIGLIALTLVVPLSGGIGMTQGQADASPANRSCPSAPTRSAIALPEVHGMSTHGRLWALLFYRPPARVGVTEKIVLRMTGSGPLHVTARRPGGGIFHPTWGPEAHGGSNWNRPGDEWGTGWTFPSAGCWSLHAWRHGAAGNVWLRVKANT